MPIRSPGANRSAPGPTASTTPTTSCPGTVRGRRGCRSPSARCRSVRHTPHALTRTRTSPGPGCGSGSVTDRSGPRSSGPGRSTTHARTPPSWRAPGPDSRAPRARLARIRSATRRVRCQDGNVLLADVVATSAAVGATRSRKAKTAALADLLRRAGHDEIEPATAWLAGEPRQSRLGTGWRTLAGIDAAPAERPALQVAAVERALDRLAATTGAGSTARRAALLGELFGAATAEEQHFLRRLLTGELRQGALDGVMLEAIAAAAEVPAAAVRRAFMLSGQLPATARLALTRGIAGLEAVSLQVGRPVRPMDASPADDLGSALALLGPGAHVEYKPDGARIQVHRDGREVRVWTRTLREITPSVPELVELVRGLPCRSVVLDGETLALRDDGRPRPFQETMSRFGAAAGELLLQPFFFD